MNAPGLRLPGVCRGRAKHTGPVLKAVPCVSVRASRPGEEQQRHDFLCSEVQLWFKQLRRLQSAVHALKAGKTATSAVVYRVSLWRSIVCARGFRAGFVDWWKSRPVQLVGSPLSFPSLIPSFAVCDILFQDFRCNYKAFESWHIRHRTQVLAAQYSSVCDVLVRDLREPAPEQVDTLLIRKAWRMQIPGPAVFGWPRLWTCEATLSGNLMAFLFPSHRLPMARSMLDPQPPLVLTLCWHSLSCSPTLLMLFLNSKLFGLHAGANTPQTQTRSGRVSRHLAVPSCLQDILRWRPSPVGSGSPLSSALSPGRPEARTHLPGRTFCTCLPFRSNTSWPFLAKLRPANERGRTNSWPVRSLLCANRTARIVRVTDRSCFFQSFIGFGLAFGLASSSVSCLPSFLKEFLGFCRVGRRPRSG